MAQQKPSIELTATRMRVLGHPVRIRALGTFNGRARSPTEIAAELECPLGKVAYHVRLLASAGALVCVKEVPRRGALEHFYVLTDEGRSLIQMVETFGLSGDATA